MKHKIILKHLPLHPRKKLAALFMLCLFLFLVLYVTISKLGPAPITARAINQSIDTRVYVLNSTSFLCNYTLEQGTNLVSFPCLTTNTDLDEFFENLSSSGSNIHTMWKYTPSRAGKWEVYNRTLPSYAVDSLSVVSRNDGYYIFMDAAETFIYYGFPPSSFSLSLAQGWNLVGYPSTILRTLDTSLASIAANYERIRTWEGTIETGQFYENISGGTGNLTNTSIYNAYWINMTTGDTWVIS